MDEQQPEADIPLFDVVVKMPPGRRLEEVERMAVDAGIQPERINALIKVLRSVPEAKIGAGVTRERADRAKEQFGQAGLTVVVTPLLALQSMVTGAIDTRFSCPACGKKVQLPENRQCPECHVFVDKVTEEMLLKRKLMEQERARLESQIARDAKEGEKKTRESMEAALRAQIREELEEEFGLSEKGVFHGRAGKLRAAGLVGVVAVAFFGGSIASGLNLPWVKKANAGPTATASAAPDVDKMLDSVGPKGDTSAAAQANGGPLTGDPDVDDPLVQAAGGKRIGAKGISMEQAVAAAQTLAKSAGNGTGQGAGGVGTPPGVGAAGGADAAAVGEVQISRGKKVALTAEFARQLAELGHAARAREIIKSLKAAPEAQSDLQLAAAVRLADYEVRAWELRDQAESKARRAIDSLMSDVATLPDPRERSLALSRVAAILSRHAQLPPEAARAFLTQASESLKAIPEGQRASATGEWAVSMGEVLVAEVALRARVGLWSRATAAAGQLSTLTRQPSDSAAQARLLALEYQAWNVIGQQDKALPSLDAALGLAAKEGFAQRAALLRRIAQLSGAAEHEKLQAAVASLQAQLEPLSGAEKAQALTQLSLLYADAGLRSKADHNARQAQATAGLTPADTVAVQTDLIVKGDLAEAKRLHGQSQYAQSEEVLRRLGDYLL